MTTNTDPLLYLDIDGVLLRRRHAGMFDASRSRPIAWIFSNGQQVYFNVGGSRPGAALVGLMAHVAPSAMLVHRSTLPGGRYSI